MIQGSQWNRTWEVAGWPLPSHVAFNSEMAWRVIAETNKEAAANK